MIALLAKYLAPLAAGACALLLIALGVQTARVSVLEADVAKKDAEFANYRTVATEHANAALVERERERLALEKSKQENVDAAVLQAQVAQQDAATARTAGERLRSALTAARSARCAADPRTVVGPAGPAASAPADLFADVQRRLDEAADGIAQYADATRVASELCVRQYTSLIKTE